MNASRSAAQVALMAAAAALATLAADQASKAAIRSSLEPGERADVIFGVDFVRVTNDGVAFGLLGGQRGVTLAITLAAIALLVALVVRHPDVRGLWAAVGLLVGGAIGNLVDRLAHGRVTDFIDVGAWPAFNLADVAITAGVVLLLIGQFQRDGEAAPAAGP